MSNGYLFATFAIITIVFFVHNWLIASRQRRLEKTLEELKSKHG